METVPTPRKPWYRRLAFRISVRALIVLVLVVGGGLGWIVHQARVQRDAVAAITKVGGVVHYEWQFHDGYYEAIPKRPWPKWLVDAIGIDLLAAVTQVQIGRMGPSDTSLTDAALVEVGKLRSLEALWIEGNNVTEAGLANLAGLSRLKHLEVTLFGMKGQWMKPLANLAELEQLQIGFLSKDEELEPLSGLHRLRSLRIHWFDESQITDAGLAHLAELHELRELEIDRSSITDEGLSHFRGMIRLERLMMSSPNLSSLEPLRPLVHLHSLDVQGSGRLSDSGVAVLAAFPDLRFVNLDETGIGDAGLHSLRDSKTLEVLMLCRTKTTDEGLAALANVNSLRLIRIFGTKISDEAARETEAAHPGLKVLAQ